MLYQYSFTLHFYCCGFFHFVVVVSFSLLLLLLCFCFLFFSSLLLGVFWGGVFFVVVSPHPPHPLSFFSSFSLLLLRGFLLFPSFLFVVGFSPLLLLM